MKAESTAQHLAERVDALAVMLDALLDDRSVPVETATALAA
jgi:hypothetical protein